MPNCRPSNGHPFDLPYCSPPRRNPMHPSRDGDGRLLCPVAPPPMVCGDTREDCRRHAEGHGLEWDSLDWPCPLHGSRFNRPTTAHGPTAASTIAFYNVFPPGSYVDDDSLGHGGDLP